MQAPPLDTTPFTSQAPPRSGMPIGIVVALGCGCISLPLIVILAAVLFPVFARSRAAALRTGCFSNEKQLGLGIRMYAADWDESLPNGSTWMDALKKYSRNESTFHCPASGNQRSEVYGYAFNKNLGRKRLAKIARPQTAVMLYDSTDLRRNASDAVTSLPSPARHLSTNNLLYVDGHAQSVRQKTPDDAP